MSALELPRDLAEATLAAAVQARSVLHLVRQYLDEERLGHGLPPDLRVQLSGLLFGADVDLDNVVGSLRDRLATPEPRKSRLPGIGPVAIL